MRRRFWELDRVENSIAIKTRKTLLQLERLEDRWAPALLDPLTQPRFVNLLTKPAVMPPTTPGGTHYEVPIVQVQQNLGLINPNNGQPLLTTVWGYNGTYPGPTIEAQRDQPITVHWNNQLISNGTPLPHLLANELMQPLPATGVPLVTHLHGGHTPSTSDGLPEAWATPNYAETGPDFRRQVYQYPNDQPASTLWYHDHAMTMTRLNVYAGLAGFYLIREPFESSLNLPAGNYEIPLAIQDRSFNDDGSLAYPPMNMMSGSVGNFILVNGKAWPALDVEPRKYRFRILNGSDSRFLNLGMTVSGGGTAPIFYQLGTDQGFLEQSRTASSILMGSAERTDVIIDFSDPALAGKSIILTNSAPIPFPNGSNPNSATVGQLMAFRVTKPLIGTDTSQVPTTLRPLPNLGTPVRTRQLLLSFGAGMMGVGAFLGTVADGRLMYADGVTETPNRGDTEIWEFYNSTPSSHPVHMHLTPFQVLSRQGFTATVESNGALSNIQLVGSPSPPLPEHAGEKDTIIVEPGQVVRVLAKFDRPGEYVWHCHMLAHEDNEMMRPIMVNGPALVDNVTINNGTTQRSKVTTMKIDFDSLVNLPTNPADAFELRRQFANDTVTLSAAVTNTDYTSVTLTFTGGPVDFGSLADGRYTLTVFSSQVSNANGALDGNDDGVAGGNYLLVGTPVNGLFRLFGDANGSGSVTAADFNAFRLVYGTAGPSIFDFNGDNQVTASDFNQFRTRYGVMI